MDDIKSQLLRKKTEEIKARRIALKQKSESKKTKSKTTILKDIILDLSNQPKSTQLFLLIWFASILGPFFYLLLSKNFVPSLAVKQSAFYLSIIYAAALIILMLVAVFKGKIPKARGKKNKLMQLISIPLMPFFIYGWFWLNFAVVIPKTITDVFGSPTTEVVKASKRSSYSRYICDYSLTLQPYASFYFRFCLSENSYMKLPENEFEVKVHWIESLWGKSIQSVELSEFKK